MSVQLHVLARPQLFKEQIRLMQWITLYPADNIVLVLSAG